MRDVFHRLGFDEDWSTVTDQQPAYIFDLGAVTIKAAQVMGLDAFMRPIFILSGAYSTRDTVGMIHYEIPLEVESFEQGVAFIAYALRSHTSALKPVEWLQLGRDWASHLPWNRAAVAYDARPHCSVSRAWFKVAASDLRAYAVASSAGGYVSIGFDGMLLIFDCGSMKIAIPGLGTAWNRCFAISVNDLLMIPRRLMSDPIEIGVWKEHISIARMHLPLVNGAERGKQ